MNQSILAYMDKLKNLKEDEKILILYKSKSPDSLVSASLLSLYLKQYGLLKNTYYQPIKNLHIKNDYGLLYYNVKHKVTLIDSIMDFSPTYIINLGVYLDFTTLHLLENRFDDNLFSMLFNYVFKPSTEYYFLVKESTLALELYKTLKPQINKNMIYDKSSLEGLMPFEEPGECFDDFFNSFNEAYYHRTINEKTVALKNGCAKFYINLVDDVKILPYAINNVIKCVLNDLDTFLHFKWTKSTFFLHGELAGKIEKKIKYMEKEYEQKINVLEIDGEQHNVLIVTGKRKFTSIKTADLLENNKYSDIVLDIFNRDKIDFNNDDYKLVIEIKTKDAEIKKLIYKKLGRKDLHVDALLKMSLGEFKQLMNEGVNGCVLLSEVDMESLITEEL